MTQYVKQFPLPDPSSATAREMIRLAKAIYRLASSEKARELEDELDRLVWQAFGFTKKT